MNINHFIHMLKEHDISFYTGVPDSLLKVFIDNLVSTYGVNNHTHVITHNEGGSVGLACGYYLSTGKVPCVYLQNSGLGNAINPITSLSHPAVCGIPMLFVVGWRGEPGTKDEPQHMFQGEITLDILDMLGIEYYVVDEETSIDRISRELQRFCELFTSGKSAAFVIRKGAFEGQTTRYSNNYSMTREKAIEIILNNVDASPVIATTGKISRELYEIRAKQNSNQSRDFLTVGAMGHSAMIALGIAMYKPDVKVWCMDGDGASLMHLGGVATIGNHCPRNLVHVVLNNSAHESVGGVSTAAENVCISEIAQVCGYSYVYKVSEPQTLLEAVEKAKTHDGAVMIEVFVKNSSRKDLSRPICSPEDNKSEFMNYFKNICGKSNENSD